MWRQWCRPFQLGTWQLFISRKGAPLHRAVGYIYLTLMTITAITTPFVHQIMPNSRFYGLSPVHLLIPLTLFGVIGALHGAWTHNIREHKTAMIALYVGAMLIAGSLTLLPGRIMHAVVLAAEPISAARNEYISRTRSGSNGSMLLFA